MKENKTEEEITLDDVIKCFLKEGIIAGLALDKLRLKKLEQTAYDKGWIDSRF